jgi:uncharacterized protein YrrD
MRLGKDLLGKLIISVADGRNIGSVKDLYVNQELDRLTGIHVGSEGLIRRKSRVIARDDVVVFGIDAILVKKKDVITSDEEHPEAGNWLRLGKLRSREVNTPGGTRVGAVGDVILSEEGQIMGFALSKVYVEGPVADQGTIPRTALVATGEADGVMTIDLVKVEGTTTEQVELDEEHDLGE